jgi:hypothetical protein
VQSPDIARITLHKKIPFEYHIYALPFATLYPIWLYGYLVKYETWFRSEEWTFIFTVGLIVSHSLSFLVTRWSISAKALITCTKVRRLQPASSSCADPHSLMSRRARFKMPKSFASFLIPTRVKAKSFPLLDSLAQACRPRRHSPIKRTSTSSHCPTLLHQ